MKKIFTLCLALCSFYAVVNAQSGDLDSTFAMNGVFTMDFDQGIDTGHDVVVQPDGKILVSFVTDLDPTALQFEAAVARLNENGTLDSTFANNGWFHLPNPSGSDHAFSINLLDDGSILLGGAYAISVPNSALMVLKLTSDGNLDNSFGANGVVIKDIGEGLDYLRGLDVDAEGNIYGGGESQIGTTNHEKAVMISLNADGSDNMDFGDAGLFEWNVDSISNRIHNIHVNDDGSILAAGLTRPTSADLYALYKIKSDGTGLDSTFAVNGEALPPVEGEAYGMEIHPNGTILLSGNVFTGSGFALALIGYTADGNLNPDFGVDGVVFSSFFIQQTGYDIAIQPDGKIVIAGEEKDGGFFAPKLMFTARYSAEGVVDSTWGGTGAIATQYGNTTLSFANAVAVQPDGKVVIVGTTRLQGTLNDLTVIRFQNRIDVDGDGFYLGVDDCDDMNADINPNGVEVPYNGIDDDCNPATLDDDLDGDGFVMADDCDDTNADISPDATEIAYNGVDDDCNAATLDDDLDGDGYALADDCDDTNAELNPGITEIPYNGIDDDCDETTPDDDLDGDGWYHLNDCDDTNADIHPQAEDIPNNGIDEDCDGEDSVVSTDEITLAQSFVVSPNPASDLVRVQWENSSVEVEKIELLDYTGKVQFSATTFAVNHYEVAVSDLPSGMYLINIYTTEGNAIHKLIID